MPHTNLNCTRLEDSFFLCLSSNAENNMRHLMPRTRFRFAALFLHSPENSQQAAPLKFLSRIKWQYPVLWVEQHCKPCQRKMFLILFPKYKGSSWYEEQQVAFIVHLVHAYPFLPSRRSVLTHYHLWFQLAKYKVQFLNSNNSSAQHWILSLIFLGQFPSPGHWHLLFHKGIK